MADGRLYSDQMIIRSENIAEVEPIYKTYLDYISRFFQITHFYAWRERALENLQDYASGKNRHLFLEKESGKIIGFAMINQHLRFNAEGLAVAEFFIEKTHEKKGYGRMLAEHVFLTFPGKWEVAVTLQNKSALMFWEKVIRSHTGGNYIKKENTCFNGYGFIFNTGFKQKKEVSENSGHIRRTAPRKSC